MQIQITPYFQKRLKELPKPTRESIIEAIERCEIATSLRDILHLKDLKSKKKHRYFRIRVGSYRIGFELIQDVLVFQTLGNRGDFYKEYPPK
jgi:mRNA-degrading endonuclease RelE of RelBE toxin-antitoxin system